MNFIASVVGLALWPALAMHGQHDAADDYNLKVSLLGVAPALAMTAAVFIGLLEIWPMNLVVLATLATYLVSGYLAHRVCTGRWGTLHW